MRRLVFMGAVLFRLVLLVCLSLAAAGLFNAYWGMVVLIAGLAVEVFLNLSYTAKLAEWLETDGLLDTLPKTNSKIWNEIFSRVYKSRRALQKNTKRLQSRETRYRKTLTSLPEAIVLIKNDWTLSWCNERAQEIFGLKSEEDAGRHLFALISDEALTNYLKGGEYDASFYWQNAENAKTYEVRVVIVDTKYSLIVVHDVTEQERLNAARRDFVANVSHELRTPLTALSGFIDIAVSGNGAIQPQHLRLMQDQATRMRLIVDDLLALSRLEMGVDELQAETVDMSAVVQSCIEEVKAVAKGSHEIAGEVRPDTLLTGYPNELQSAVTNLLTNAVRYTPAGGHIVARCGVNEKGEVQLSVKDDGIGIKAKDIPRLTERFYRVDKSRSRETGGTGLGLAIVKHILMHHNARLVIDSTFGEGSVFTVIFPPSRTVKEESAA